MKESTSKEKIFKNIRNALVDKLDERQFDVDFSKSIYTKSEDPLEIQFAKNFTSVNGKFIFCESINEFSENIKLIYNKLKWDNVICLEEEIGKIIPSELKYSPNMQNLKNIDVAITSCEFLVSRLGSVMVSSAQLKSRQLFIYAPIHIVVAYTSQLVYDISDALDGIKNKYQKKLPSLITNITGPSRTADIEKTLILGAHGPREIYVFLIDN